MRRDVTIMTIIGAALLIGAARPPAERTIAGSGIADARVNGMPGKLRLEPGGPGVPLLNSGWAQRAGLKRGFFTFRYVLGKQTVSVSPAVARLDLGSESKKRRMAFTDLAYARGIDGAMGPGGLSEPIVRFVLRPSVPGERTVALPMVDGGGIFGSVAGLFAQIQVGGAPLRVRFDPWHRHTLATAAVGVRIATAQDGRATGPSRLEEIVFGIERPVRTVALARPLVVGPLSLTSIGVRTFDYGNASAIPDADADPDEIVVTAKAKKSRGQDRLSIGSDYLDRCSSIVFDKPAKVIRLSCR